MEPQTAGQEAGRFEQLGQQALGYVAELPGRFMESARTFRDNAQTYGAVGLTGAVSVAGVAKMEDVLTPDSVASDKSVPGELSSGGKLPKTPGASALVPSGLLFVNKEIKTKCGDRATQRPDGMNWRLQKGKKETYDMKTRLRSMKNCAKWGKRTVSMSMKANIPERGYHKEYFHAEGPFETTTNHSKRFVIPFKEERKYCPDPENKKTATRFMMAVRTTWNPKNPKRPNEVVTHYKRPRTVCAAAKRYPRK